MPNQAEENTVVLVMDRRDEDVKLIQSMLDKAGLHVTNCSSGNDAREFFRTYRTSIRLAIVDPATPGVHLPEFLDAVSSDIPILFLAGDELYDSLPLRGFPTNVRGKLRKPFRRANFLGAVLSAVDERFAQAV